MSDFTTEVMRAQEQVKIREDVDRLVPDENPQQEADRLRDHAALASHEHAAEAESIAEAFTALTDEVRSIRDEAKAGRLSKADAVKRLSELRREYGVLKRRHASLRLTTEDNKRTLDDPAAERDRLLSKYPSLRR